MEFATLHLLTEELEEEFVLVEFVGTHVDDEMEGIWNDVMLCSAFHDGHRQLRGAQQRTGLTELVVAQPYQVIEGFVDGVHTFLSGSMA